MEGFFLPSSRDAMVLYCDQSYPATLPTREYIHTARNERNTRLHDHSIFKIFLLGFFIPFLSITFSEFGL